MKVFYVTVRVVVEDEVNLNDFASEVECSFEYPGVVETELLEVETK